MFMTQIKHRFAISIFVTLLLAGTSNITAQEGLSADQVTQNVADKLASVKTMKFRYERELNYPSEGYLNNVFADSFLDLKPADGALGFKYQFFNDDLLAVYNGSEKFTADKKNKTIRVESEPPLKSFASFGFFYYSPLTLKNILPKLIADKTIQKKVTVAKIGGVDHYVLEFVLSKESIDPILGEIYVPKSDRKSIFRLTVNKTTLLPVEVFAGNDQNQDFAKIDFLDMKEGVPEPSDLTWYYSTYSKEYKLEIPADFELIKSGQNAPDFNLPQFGSNSQVSLNQYKGKVTLLEFWIANCGFCIGAVPRLNAIAQNFRDKNFEFVSINNYDSAKTIDLFKNNNKPEYRILNGEEKLAASYGVSSFPSFVLVGKDGRVIYSKAGLYDEELLNAISNSL
jgi:thiol-disulfide isomerase/thioredoxin